MPPEAPKLLTTGEIARRLDEPQHRVEYVLRTRPHIRPTALAGRVRLYDNASMRLIRHALAGIDARLNPVEVA